MKFFLKKNSSKYYMVLLCLTCLLVIVGVGLRFYNINKNDFVFYDEGYYLNYNRPLGELLMRYYPDHFQDFKKAVNTYVLISLSTGKALWFLIADARYFVKKLTAWYYPKIISAIMGVLTFFMLFKFAKRFYSSQLIAWIAVALLAILPSHVFYSRIGLQEALSTLLFLMGFYFYIFPRKFGWRTFLAGFMLAGAFFSNYRLIILPVLVGFCEFYFAIHTVYQNKDQKSKSSCQRYIMDLWQRINIRKYVWWLITFSFFIVVIGNIDNGRNTVVTFSWMFHQAHLAEEHFDPINLLSYPYYIFRLENVFFGFYFFSNIYFWFIKKKRIFFPFCFVLLQMFIFSFTSSKGARYLCVMTPFMVMSVAYVMYMLFQNKRARIVQYFFIFTIFIMIGGMLNKSMAIASITSDYQKATNYLLSKDKDVQFVSTQSYIQNLFVRNRDQVKECPQHFFPLVRLYSEGYRYLVLGPQSYISWTAESEKFFPHLKGHLEYIIKNFKPIQTFFHFNDVMLERFVFEHSSNLKQSIRFLRLSKKEHYGKLSIYDLSQAIPVMLTVLTKEQIKK